MIQQLLKSMFIAGIKPGGNGTIGADNAGLIRQFRRQRRPTN